MFQAALEAEEDDEEERDRDAADFYALQRSRRVFAASRLTEGSETDPEMDSRASLGHSGEEDSKSLADRPRGMGINSSWQGTRSSFRRQGQDLEAQSLQDDARSSSRRQQTRSSDVSRNDDSKASKMVSVGLESQVEGDNGPPADLLAETEGEHVPAFRRFTPTAEPGRFAFNGEEEDLAFDYRPRPDSVDTQLNLSPLATVTPEAETFKHDAFFAWIYLIALASMLASFVMVYLHTSTPSGKLPWGDTIYTVLRSSFHLLAVDTVAAVIVSLVWLTALKSFARPLVILLFFAVPIILFSFSLYPLISSYQGRSGGKGFQDWVMRWAAIIPAVGGIAWLYLAYQARHSVRTAIDILDFASRILSANSALVLVGMGSLATVVLWTWAWLAMFTRVFLGGYFTPGLSRFIISASSWWLGAYFVLMYVWTISIVSGVQRGTTAATVSQWYFYRNNVPAPSSTEVVMASLNHSLTTIFGSISLSTGLAMLIRLPLLILPARLADVLGVLMYQFIPTPVAAITNPLALTYAAIHSRPLAFSARDLSKMTFLMPDLPTSTLTPRTFKNRRAAHSPLLPYRLAKLILHATRFVMAIGLGFAGWVITARQLQIKLPDGISIRGSAYAYVVGIVASFIGWGVLGAMEGVLSGIVDAVVICYGSEKQLVTGGGGYCMEAATLFGDRGADDRGREALY